MQRQPQRTTRRYDKNTYNSEFVSPEEKCVNNNDNSNNSNDSNNNNNRNNKNSNNSDNIVATSPLPLKIISYLVFPSVQIHRRRPTWLTSMVRKWASVVLVLAVHEALRPPRQPAFKSPAAGACIRAKDRFPAAAESSPVLEALPMVRRVLSVSYLLCIKPIKTIILLC